MTASMIVQSVVFGAGNRQDLHFWRISAAWSSSILLSSAASGMYGMPMMSHASCRLIGVLVGIVVFSPVDAAIAFALIRLRISVMLGLLLSTFASLLPRLMAAAAFPPD